MPIRLGLPKSSRWLSLPHGVRIKVRPLTSAVYYAARQTAARQVTQYAIEQGLLTEAGATIADAPDAADRDQLDGLQTLYFVQALAVYAIEEWEGVVGKDGAAAAVNSETTKQLMTEQPAIADDFLVQYTRPITEAIVEGEG